MFLFEVALVVRNPPANAGEARDTGSILGSGRSPEVGYDTPLQYSCLGNSRGRGVWWSTVHGVAKGQTQLSDWKPHHHGYWSLCFFKKWVAKWLNCTVHYIAHPLKRALYLVIILPSKMTLNTYENNNGKHVWTRTHTHTHTHILRRVLLNCRVTSCLSFITKVMCPSKHSSPGQNGMVSNAKFVR